MDQEEFDAELSSDDEDYCPGKQIDSASENSQPDDDKDSESDEDSEKKKAPKKKATNRRKSSKPVKSEVAVIQSDPEEEKRRAEALWAEFLGGDTPEETKENASSAKPQSSSASTSAKSIPISTPTPAPTLKPVFEFAGETIEIPSKTEEAAKEAPAAVASPKVLPGLKRPSAGGLGSVLSQLTKKTKLSVLEKTKIDWDGFKDGEGISEELQTHNRGRDGFLERRDFLERTDLRQFEIEKSLRMSGRRK